MKLPSGLALWAVLRGLLGLAPLAGVHRVITRAQGHRLVRVRDGERRRVPGPRVREDETLGPPERVLSLRLPGTSQGWTPPLGRCLEPGASYAWSVGANGDWSEASLFEISAAPSVTEVEEAMAVLRSFVGDRQLTHQVFGGDDLLHAGDANVVGEIMHVFAACLLKTGVEF